MSHQRILVVDDEPALLGLIARSLQGAGHTVESAADPEQALTALSARVFDLALVDLNLPRMKGDQLAAEMRRRRPRLIIVLLTGMFVATLPPGVTLVLSKPFTLQELRLVVAAAARLNY
jgi:DNA-binding response OmpR family regulator